MTALAIGSEEFFGCILRSLDEAPPATTADGAHPNMSDGRIGIRQFRGSDVPFLHAATHESMPELSTWMLWCDQEYSMDNCAAFVARSESNWNKSEEYNVAIYSVPTGSLLGSVGINR